MMVPSGRSLTMNQFSPAMFFDHIVSHQASSYICLARASLSLQSKVIHRYNSAHVSSTIASLPTDVNQKTGISVIAFNADGTLITTRNDSMPTTVWIWSLKLLSPYAVLVQHSAVRSVQWHPTCPDLLMFQCVHEERLVYLWSSRWEQPRIVGMPSEKLAGRQEARWIRTSSDQRPTMMLETLKTTL
jgi:hypothetical protein